MPLPLIPLALAGFNWFKDSWVGKAVAIVGVVLFGWMVAKRSGRKQAEAAENIRKAQAVEDMKEIKDEVNALPDADRRSELRSWVRGKDKR